MNSQAVITQLNTLIETCKDGEHGFRTTAEHAQTSSLKQMFQTRADDCRQAAVQLQSLVRQHGGEAETEGSTSGALHRGWVAVKGELAGYSDLNMLEETERGEDVALKAYREALQDDSLPSDVRGVVEQQYQGVKRNHEQIRSLRDQARATAH